ncbi:MAG: hypothetical protein KC486_11910 [Myxococcales bacterium]|nr:hypothetical protein [Myxococcales bacterium]MCA9689094.1 hypothetical protein [Myxococcales bacterium]
MSTLAPLLALLLAGALLSRVGRGRASTGQQAQALVRLSSPRGADDRAQRWRSLRLLIVVGAVGLLLVVALPWLAAAGAPACVVARAGEACTPGETLPGIAGALMALACTPLLLVLGGELGR